jgi:hypothetical protein
MPNGSQTDTEKEVGHYLQVIRNEKSLPYAAVDFLSRTAASQLLGEAAKRLTTAVSTYDLSLMPAKILMAGYADQAQKDGWDVSVSFGRFVILTAAAGPLGAAVGSALLGLSVLVMLENADAAAEKELEAELIASMAAKLDQIRADARASIERARQRETATDADDADEGKVLATIQGRKFTENDRSRMRTFFDFTLPALRSLDPDTRRLYQLLVKELGKVEELRMSDLALIYAMGATLIERGAPKEEDTTTRNLMLAFEKEALAFVQDCLDANATIPDER